MPPAAKLILAALILVSGSVIVIGSTSSTITAERVEIGRIPDPTSQIRGRLKPCFDSTGSISWVRFECPTGSTAIQNACDAGVCEECPPEGCPELASSVICCHDCSGDDCCFEIVESTVECPPGSEIYYCEFGYCDSSGAEHCIL